MNIKSFSPLQSSGNYFLNDDKFTGELFFTDSEKNISFIIVQYDYDLLKWKVIYNGLLNGYQNNIDYDYRINIEKFIKIDTYRDFSMQVYNLNFDQDTDERVQYMNVSKQTAKLSIILNNTVDILTTYSNLISITSNGDMYLTSSPSSFTGNNTVLNYNFINKKNNSLSSFSKSKYAVVGTWFPITNFSEHYSTEPINIKIYNSENNIILENSMENSIAFCGRLFMVYVPYNSKRILLTDSNGLSKEYNVFNLCTKPYYYWGSDGLDVVYLGGNQHIIENTTKEYITLGNKQYPIKINTTKQLKRNTGFNLLEEQVFDLIKTTYINETFDGELEQRGRNLFNNSTSPNWTHNTNPAYATNNIITNDDEQYNRVTPTSGNLLNIYGMTFIYPSDNFYIASCWVRQKSGGILTYRIYESPQTEPYKDFIVPNNTWTRIHTNAFEVLQGETKSIIITQQENVSGISLEIKNVQIEYEYENYILYEDSLGYMYKLEKDGVPTVYKKSLLDSNTLVVKNKIWLLDTSNFEGYNGTKYSEKNIELTLTEEKTFKKYLNTKQNFYD